MIPDLTNRSQLSNFLKRHDLVPQKRLGQHWLASQSAVMAIASACEGGQGFLEIGPGAGVLTQRLVQFGDVLAIDLDPRVLPALAESAPAAKVLVEDILNSEFVSYLSSLPRPRVVASNLPYSITSPVLELLELNAREFDWAVLLMQKEVAEKITAAPGARNRGSLSVLLQSQFEITKVCDVPPGAFVPPPKVNSMALRLTPRSEIVMDTELRGCVRAGFQFPRKTLANNLSATFASGVVENAIHQMGFDPKLRPQRLTIEEWVRLAALLRSHES